jgi:hypothetical protein
MAVFVGGLGAEYLSAARAQAVLPTVPAPERVITPQTGDAASIGHPWGRGWSIDLVSLCMRQL